jgi:hypothetical protein
MKPKNDFRAGSSELSRFWYWINERHSIWIKRKDGFPKPWSSDWIFQEFKFTNAFRQLDTGTIWLGKLLKRTKNPELTMFTCCWYRMFNWYMHAEYWYHQGCVPTYSQLVKFLGQRYRDGDKVFTSAHMTCGLPGVSKLDAHLESAEVIWNERAELIKVCKDGKMQTIFEKLRDYQCIGKFIAYEIACDLRFTDVLMGSDRNTWSNVGPGAKRGLKRLGMEPTVDAMIELRRMAKTALAPHVRSHFRGTGPPLELREIEHSLCEFDKYERVRTGAGRPRQKFDGV